METTCLCKAITVKVSHNWLDGKQHGHVCHCLNCRKVSGTALGVTNLPVPRDMVTITGEMYLYDDYDTISGQPVHRYFCKVCCNPIKSESHLLPDSIILKMGIFEHIPKPKSEGFVGERQAWGQPVANDVEQMVWLQLA
ncbi:Mss4-like protein [Aspergillus fruticulosus]